MKFRGSVIVDILRAKLTAERRRKCREKGGFVCVLYRVGWNRRGVTRISCLRGCRPATRMEIVFAPKTLRGKIIRRSGFVARVDHSCWILRRRRVKRQFKSEDECTGAFDTGGGGGMLAVQFEKECVTKPCLRKFPTDSPGSFVPTLVSLFDFEVCRGRWTDEWSLFDGRNYVMQYVIRAQHSPLHVRSFETLIRLQGIEKKRRNKSTRGVKTIRIFRRKFDE